MSQDGPLPVETVYASAGMPLTFGSLFAGIGGIDLGFERAGMVCKWQVEIDPYAQKVLAKHWPNVRRHDDIRTWPQPDTERVDVICGGFPCQDISYAGKGAGIHEGTRSGLWSEYVRIICDIKPRFIVVENVAALLVRGLDRVLRDLATCGYDAEWAVLSACQWGYPHARERLFCVAYPDCGDVRTSWPAKDQTGTADVFVSRIGEITPMESRRAIIADVDSAVYGVPGVVDRIRGYGNAVVPDIAEWIGRRIVAAANDADYGATAQGNQTTKVTT